jgi:hypothetical protein
VDQIKEEKEEMMVLIKEEKGEHPSLQTNALNVRESVIGKFFIIFNILFMQTFNSSCDESIKMDHMNDGTCERNLIFFNNFLNEIA